MCQFKNKKSLSHSSPYMCATTQATALLHSTRSKYGGHPQSSVQWVDWSSSVDFNIMSHLPSTVFRGLNNVSKVKFSQQVEVQTSSDQRHLGRDRMADAFRPGQILTCTKKQACSRPLLLSPAKTTPGKECVNLGMGLDVNGVCVCLWVMKEGHVKVRMHLKTLT